MSVDNATSVGSSRNVKSLRDTSMLSMLLNDVDHDEGKGETNELDARLRDVSAAQLSSVGSPPVTSLRDTIATQQQHNTPINE